jgi:hypothetical protein
MTLKLHRPNTHALWDPRWAEGVVADHYAAQFTLFDELLRYAADLALRSLSSAPDGIPHHMILSVLFRQCIATADSVGALLRVGAVDQANLQLRALIEARWALIYGLRDPDKWGRHIYVASIRENRSRAKRMIPGTDEYKVGEYERQLRETYGSPPGESEDPKKAQEYVTAIDAVLAKPENAAASAALDAFFQQRNYEGPWYFDGSAPEDKQVKSIRGLAKAVDAQGEYDSVYKYTSYHVHGGYYGTAVSLDDMGAYVAHIRTPEDLRQAMVLAFGLLSESCLRVIRQWRSEEEPRFVAQYRDKWRDLIRNCPEVQVERSRAVNR